MNAEFVDTNILIYAHATQVGAKKQRSIELLGNIWDQENGAISTQVLGEFYNSVTRELNLKSEDAEEIVRELRSWTIHRPDHADVLNAIRLQRTHQLSWWDAMIVNSAMKTDAQILWTEDLNHGQRFGSLVVQNPFL